MKNIIKILLGIFIFSIITVIKPFINIRIGKYPIDRIGPYTVVPEIWKRKKKIMDIKSFDLWSHTISTIPNSFLHKIVAREITFIPIYIYSSLETFFYFFNLHNLRKNFFLKPYTRDSHNIIDNFKPILKISNEDQKEAESILTKNKIDFSKKIVCINVRDSFFLNKIFPNYDASYHNRRDADVENYLDAIKYLISKGYLVIRMGKYMKNRVNFEHQNFIDYPFCEFKTDILDVYFGYKCFMAISSGSGWDSIPYSFRKPILYTNFSSHSKLQLSSAKHMSIFKLVKNSDNKYLKIEELLDNDLNLITNIYRDKKSVFSELEYIENTNDELLDAVKEFENYINNDFKLNKEQKILNAKFLSHFKADKVHDIYGEPAHSKFLTGVISTSFLKKYEQLLF